MNLLTISILVVVVAYIAMILTAGKTSEGFVANLIWLPDKRPNTPDVVMEQRFEAPYVQNAIYSVDDYEYNLVFQNESDKELSKAQINRMTAQRPLDWSNQPPNSAVFQKGVAEMRQRQQQDASYSEGYQDTANANMPYKEIDGSSLDPPDTSAIELEERKILQSYVPAKADSLTTYDLEDAKTLINKVYNAKGLIPTVVQKPNNVFEVVGVRKKDEKVMYEDEEAPAKIGAVMEAGEASITVPPTAADIAVGLDPFYTPAPSDRTNRWDYTKFTPGLERTFAPTFAQESWI
jgi:hypothetical protein